ALRPGMADREAGEPAGAVPQQHRVAEPAGKNGADLAAQVEPVMERIGQFAGGGLRLRALALAQLRVARPTRRRRARPGRRRHDRGQKARVKAELAVKPDVLGALREGEEPGVADAPAFERLARGGDEALADAAI